MGLKMNHILCRRKTTIDSNMSWNTGKYLTFFICLTLSLEGLIDAQSFDYSNKVSTFKEKFLEISKSCSATHKVSLVEIMALLQEKHESDNKQAKCFIFCMLQRYQVIDKSGDYHPDKLEKFLDSMPESRFKSSLKSNKDKCLKEDADNVCQKAYKFIKCFYRSGVTKAKNN